MRTPIKHLVVLMLENRSFDHMLGFSGIQDANGLKIDGLDHNANAPIPTLDGRAYPPTMDAEFSGDFDTDPGHDFIDVNKQLFETATPAAGQTPTMKGFAQSYRDSCGGDISRAGNVMKCFNSKMVFSKEENQWVPDKGNIVPVISTLAANYAVCDRWFSSVPGPTLPNRLFAHAGTSDGRLDLSPDNFEGFRTVYEVLDNDTSKFPGGVSSCIYSDGWTATATFRYLLEHQQQFYGTLDDFEDDCADDQLPHYCFLEPRYSSGLENDTFRPQNDQHPDSDVREGEELVYRVYQAIRSNRRVWESTMLVVTYDEHGGIYDHVPPPAGPSPDGRKSDNPAFDFTRLGVRVPAVIVSPYTRNVVIHDRAFDHTSLIATARKLFTKNWQDEKLGLRAMRAQTFDETAMNLDSPRTDHVHIRPHINRAPSPAKMSLNDLQKKHLQHAWWLDSRLPKGLQIRGTMAHIKDLTDERVKVMDFKNITEQQASAFASRVFATARNLPKGHLGRKG